MPDPHNLELRVVIADLEPVRAMLLASVELGNAVDAYFAFYGYTDRNRERLPDPDRVMWDALEKWRGLNR